MPPIAEMKLMLAPFDWVAGPREASVAGDEDYRASFPCAVTVVPSALLD